MSSAWPLFWGLAPTHQRHPGSKQALGHPALTPASRPRQSCHGVILHMGHTPHCMHTRQQSPAVSHRLHQGLMTMTISLEEIRSQLFLHCLRSRSRTHHIQAPGPSSGLPHHVPWHVRRSWDPSRFVSLLVMLSVPFPSLSLSLPPTPSPHPATILLSSLSLCPPCFREAPFRHLPLPEATLHFPACVSPEPAEPAPCPTAMSTQSSPGSRATSSLKPTLITSSSSAVLAATELQATSGSCGNGSKYEMIIVINAIETEDQGCGS